MDSELGTSKRPLRILSRAVLFGIVLVAYCVLSGCHCGVPSAPSVTNFTAPPTGEWRFVVSGDSRNCGDLIMPAVAAGAARDKAKFYWHLGDFRALYTQDEDISTRKELNLEPYKAMAWDDFVQMQVAPFKKANLPVFLGIGNHELVEPKTREEFRKHFADWIHAPGAQEAGTYYHWSLGGVDFINLDNASPDMFDGEQLKWFYKLLRSDLADSSVRAIVVGMHKALPQSLSNWHSMAESPQGTTTGRCVYKRLAKALPFRKVYILASHSHFYMTDIYNTDFWRKNAPAIVPGWIIGTAGAVRYRLPDGLTAPAATDMYGYLLATVNVAGEAGKIRFDFRQIARQDIPADTLQQFPANLVDFCFDQNRNLTPPTTLPEPLDGPCPESD
jgi:hypothetical protein